MAVGCRSGTWSGFADVSANPTTANLDFDEFADAADDSSTHRAPTGTNALVWAFA